MGHPYAIREIARQAGLSEATVDRVLNKRGGVRESTARQVRQAIADLHRQRAQIRLGGRTFMIDIVMQAPERFSTAVRAALEAELPALHPAVLRSRWHFRETGPVSELIATLDKIAGKRHSQGVILKAPDVPEVTAAVGRLTAAGVPVVTLVTDLPGSGRLAYVGIDNRAAGATAAYLIGQWLGDRPGPVLTSLSSGFFRGEEEREMGFRSAMRARHPGRAVVEITEGDGLDATQYSLVVAALERHPEIRAVYSIGGGNIATLEAFESAGRQCAVFIAHDLDQDNARLLRERRLSAVLHHDLRQDMRRACQIIMQAHGALPDGTATTLSSAIQVVTPDNMDPLLLPAAPASKRHPGTGTGPPSGQHCRSSAKLQYGSNWTNHRIGMINTARLCDKCPARATVHVEPLDLAFCPHHWAEQPSSLKGHRYVDYGDRGVPAFQPDDASVSDADLAWLDDQAS